MIMTDNLLILYSDWWLESVEMLFWARAAHIPSEDHRSMLENVRR